MKFETRRLKSKSKTLNSMVTKFLRYLTPANIDTCWYWHLSSFRSQFWTKNAKFSNFEEIWYLDKPRVVNSMVTIFFCGSWRLSIFKIFNIGTCYFLNDGGEFNGFDLERCKWMPQRIKTWNRKTNLVSKILLVYYKENWSKIMAYFRKIVLSMQIMSTQLLVQCFNH